MPTRGMERWLTQRMSTRLGASAGRADGVCANIDYPFPRSLVGDALAAATGIDPDSDPWVPERLVWPLLRVVDRDLDEPWLASLPDAPVRRGGRRARGPPVRDRPAPRRALRPLRAAPAGDDPGVGDRRGQRRRRPGAAADGVWQAELWRRLRTAIGRPSPAERLDAACARLTEEPGIVELPDRLSLFCLTRLPGSYLRVLDALAPAREVHLFVLHPSPALWARLAERTESGHSPAHRSDGGRCRRTACSRAGARTPGSSSSCSRRTAAAPTITTRSPTRARRCSSGFRPGSGPTPHRPGRRCPPTRTRGRSCAAMTTASRSTPATAAPVRSR